jgi:sucrose-6-phosphate hydrolase SacC (GH32 family)
MNLHQIDWQRRTQPILSGMTTQQGWCRVTLYNPTVLKKDGLYRMWYLGNSSESRSNDMDLGYAESEDGIHWTEHPGNPILTSTELPEGKAWQTPHVIYDEDENVFKMWFVTSEVERSADGKSLKRFFQKLCYAVSEDGFEWKVHPESIYPSGRRPCVLKESIGEYHMWMNSQSKPVGDFNDLASCIYHFESSDGIEWERDGEPVITANEKLRSVIYPFVMKTEHGYVMWYGCHVDKGLFEIYRSTSEDGKIWTHHHGVPAFPATRQPNDFDGRYTSTPCVLDDGDRLLLYYSARDFGNLFGAGDGTLRHDAAGIYRHIGVAEGKPARRG